MKGFSIMWARCERVKNRFNTTPTLTPTPQPLGVFAFMSKIGNGGKKKSHLIPKIEILLSQR